MYLIRYLLFYTIAMDTPLCVSVCVCVKERESVCVYLHIHSLALTSKLVPLYSEILI